MVDWSELKGFFKPGVVRLVELMLGLVDDSLAIEHIGKYLAIRLYTSLAYKKMVIFS